MKKNRTVKLLGLCVILTSSLTLVGCDAYGEQVEENIENKAEQTAIENATISQEEAEQIALEEVPGTHVSTTIDDEDLAKVVYEVTIDTDSNRQVVTVDANTGDVLEVEVDDDYISQQPNLGETSQEMISQEAAEQIALASVHGTIIGTAYDFEDNTYEVGIKTSTNRQVVTVDAASGIVLDVEVETLD